MPDKDLRRTAEAYGLPKLDEKQLEEFGRGIEATRTLAARLPKDLHWSEESALILRLVGKGERR